MEEKTVSSPFMNVNEVAEYIGISISTAYKLIRKLNEELKAKGYITVSGKIYRKYLEERMYIK